MQILISGSYNAFNEGYNSAGIYLWSGLVPTESFERPIYYGSTNDFQHRVERQHLKRLESNNHVNLPLQNYFNKYGKENLVLLLIEEVEPVKQILLEREQYYLDLEKPFADEKRGFNIGKTAKSPCYWLGKKLPQYMIDGIKKRNTGRKMTQEQIEKGVAKRKGIKLSKSARENMSLSKYHPFTIISPNGEVILGYNVNKFAKENKLDPASVHCVIKGQSFHTKGWRKDITENRGVPFSFGFRGDSFSLISPIREKFQGTDIKAFSKKYNLYRGNLSSLIKGKRKEYKGWTRNEEFYKD